LLLDDLVMLLVTVLGRPREQFSSRDMQLVLYNNV
jgi:hypothetical protein